VSAAAAAAELCARLFREAPGAGRPQGPGWVQGEAVEPLSATRVRWHLRAEGGRIAEARYEVRGCPFTVAAVAWTAGELRGRPVGEVALDLEALAARLGAPAAKMGRFFVIQDALRAALLLLAPRSA
jgi:NifU-like protein involved in Fe-S cluster formation